MKKLVPFLLLLTLTANGQSLTYHPFPERNARWNFVYTEINMACPVGYSESYSIILSGDTIINNSTYHKLTIPRYQYSLRNGYRGAIRQDIAAKKVFIIHPTETAEQLLYDFTLQVGDTVKGYISDYDIVEYIDTVLVGNTFRKRWRTNSGYRVELIEGIGSTYGLVEHSPGRASDFPSFYLSCYQENNQILLPELGTQCELLTSIKPIDTTNQIEILSNPGSNAVTVKFIDASIVEIMLVDISGKMIYQQPVKGKKEIIIDNLKSGFYIMTARDSDNRMITKKIISCQ